MRFCCCDDGARLEEEFCIRCLLPFQFPEGLWAEGSVSGDCKVAFFCKFDSVQLGYHGCGGDTIEAGQGMDGARFAGLQVGCWRS